MRTPPVGSRAASLASLCAAARARGRRPRCAALHPSHSRMSPATTPSPRTTQRGHLLLFALATPPSLPFPPSSRHASVATVPAATATNRPNQVREARARAQQKVKEKEAQAKAEREARTGRDLAARFAGVAAADPAEVDMVATFLNAKLAQAPRHEALKVGRPRQRCPPTAPLVATHGDPSSRRPPRVDAAPRWHAHTCTCTC